MTAITAVQLILQKLECVQRTIPKDEYICMSDTLMVYISIEKIITAPV